MMQNTAERLEEIEVVLTFRGNEFQPLPSGALFWPAEQTLLVADLHLEKMSSFARSGQLLPPYDTRATLKRLEADLTSTGAKKLIALGDSFHRDEGTETLLPEDRLRLSRMMVSTEWLWLSGNHDPRPHELGGTCAPRCALNGLTFDHEPNGQTEGLVSGHLHPAARVSINGRSIRSACFAFDDRLLILPAYGSSTGDLNILSGAFAGLFNSATLNVIMLGRGRVYPVSPKRLIGG